MSERSAGTEGAARLALLVGRSSLPLIAEGVNTFKVGAEDLTESQLIAYFQKLPKPIRFGMTSTDGAIIVTAEPVDEELTHRQRRVNVLAFLEPVSEREAGAGSIICRAGSSRIEISLHEFREWGRCYLHTNPFSVAADYAKSEFALAQGFTLAERKRALAVAVFSGPVSLIRLKRPERHRRSQ